MHRLRVAGYSLGVSVAVFVYLALPILRETYGPVAALGAYAAIALLAGFTTYSAISYLVRSREEGVQEVQITTLGGQGDGEGSRAATTRDAEMVVEGELQTLKSQAESETDEE